VPGSAREVPPWILVGPVLARVAALLRHFTRQFLLAEEGRRSPRGRVDWTNYARRSLPTGHWDRFLCSFPDVCEDPWLLSALRWTVERVRTDLEPAADSLAARRLLEEARLILRRLGPGPASRPASSDLRRVHGDPLLSDLLKAALEAIGWVRDERGLGGTRTLDGLAWSLATEVLWEAWVESVFAEIAQRLGARLDTGREGSTRRPLHWNTPLRTLNHLAPDLALQLPGRTIWIDAKYKAHLLDLHHLGWAGLSEATREAHRSDLHQALAYASLSGDAEVDTWLVYPSAQPASAAMNHPPRAVAEVSSGSRRVRLVIAGLPFGFSGTAGRTRLVASWEQLLRSG
jgi:5-methylcytosine-specific restriction endonuclease McrBC regulatory subunit McrC